MLEDIAVWSAARTRRNGPRCAAWWRRHSWGEWTDIDMTVQGRGIPYGAQASGQMRRCNDCRLIQTRIV